MLNQLVLVNGNLIKLNLYFAV